MLQWLFLFLFVAHGRECVGGTMNNVKSGFVCGVLGTSESACWGDVHWVYYGEEEWG